MRSGVQVLLAAQILLAGLLGSGVAVAQTHHFELDAALGYQFAGGLDVEADATPGRLSLDAAPVLTAILGYRIQQNGFVFLNYSRQKTTLRYRANDGSDSGESPFTVDYLQFGGNLEATVGALTPFFGVSLGATRFAAADLGDEWRFSMVADGGVKIRLTHWLHLRGLVRVPVTILEGDSTVLCVLPGGCVARLDGTPLVQGAFLLGLGFEF